MKILAIETSCDETAAAVINGREGGDYASLSVLSNIVSSQINIHKKYGGVVPEVAAREHVLNILPVIDSALKKAGIAKRSLQNAKQKQKNKISNLNTHNPKSDVRNLTSKIDAIAVTIGPGLITSLIAGIETAKILGYIWKLPLIGINHIEGHIYANFINANSKFKKIEFPAVILTVSGGHTMLVLMKARGKFKTIGETRDDAAGEAFDKAAQLMGIGYPGGPAIANEAQKIVDYKWRVNKKNKSAFRNLKSKINLPRPMMNSNDFDFSFSGLKTALRYALAKDKNWKEKIPAYAYEFQQAVIDVLIHKTIKAALKYNIKTILLSGGVSANKELRSQLAKAAKEKNIAFFKPNLKYTTDNAAMVAAAGYYRALKKDFTPWQKLKVNCNAKLK